MAGERTIERLRRELAIAKRRLEWEAEHNQHTTAWALKAFQEQNRLSDRCTFLYGKAIEHGATCDELRAGLWLGLSERSPTMSAEAVDWEHIARLVHASGSRWQSFAEEVWEELQEWHHDGCPTSQPGPECTCHRILARMWDDLTNAADWADEPEEVAARSSLREEEQGG